MVRRSYADSPLRLEWAFEGLSAKGTHRGTHAYHSYPMRFVPQLAERLVLEYSPPNGVVCDPFMGSGTTLVEAAIQGRRALGGDINPLCRLITETKATVIPPSHLSATLSELEHRISALEEVAPVILPDEAMERLSFWHPEETYDILARILGAVQEVRDGESRRFAECAFSQILKSCSLWWPGSTRPVRSKKRRRKPQDARKAFLRQLHLMLRRNAEWWEVSKHNPPSPVETYLADARSLPFGDASVDTVITSPPYVTSYDYAELHQLSLLWLGFYTRYQDLRAELIGAQYGVNSDTADMFNLTPTAYQIAAELLSRAKERHLVRAVTAYFTGMRASIAEMYRICRSGGKTVLVIGNTRLRGVDILNAEALGEMLEEVGFIPEEVFRRPIPIKSIPPQRNEGTGQFSTTSGRNPYSEEYILVFRKP